MYIPAMVGEVGPATFNNSKRLLCPAALNAPYERKGKLPGLSSRKERTRPRRNEAKAHFVYLVKRADGI
jgi:hypothetical protein